MMRLNYIAAVLLATTAGPAFADALDARVEKLLSASPVIDGHNDLPWEIRKSYDFWRKPLALDADTSKLELPLQTDRQRMKRGHVGAQFWSVWIPAEMKGAEAIQTTLEEIDIV